MKQLEDNRPTAIAFLHHYFFAPAHREHFADAFRRRKLGTFGDSPVWAREWVRRWKGRQLSDEAKG